MVEPSGDQEAQPSAPAKVVNGSVEPFVQIWNPQVYTSEKGTGVEEITGVDIYVGLGVTVGVAVAKVEIVPVVTLFPVLLSGTVSFGLTWNQYDSPCEASLTKVITML